MRLLHINAGNLYGGIETMLVTLARFRGEVPELEQRFALCFPGRLADELSAAGTPPEILGPARASRPWTVWRARRALRALLARERFDAVACHGSWSLGLFGPVVRSAGPRLVLWVHSHGPGPRWLENLAGRQRLELVIVNSEFTAAQLRGRLSSAPAQVVHPPVAPPPPEAARSRESLRAEFGTNNEVVILSASRLERWKGLHLLIEALVRLDPVPNWTCWLVGGAQRPAEVAYLSELMQACARGGIAKRVRFLGERRDVRALVAAADILCQPNVEPEPFGVIFVEALFAGTPIVSTAMGGALEIVDADTGLLVDPEPNAVSDALRLLVGDPRLRNRLAKAGPSRAAGLSEPARQIRLLARALTSQGVHRRAPQREVRGR